MLIHKNGRQSGVWNQCFLFLPSAHMLCEKLLTTNALSVNLILVKFRTKADVSLSKDVFDNAIKRTLKRVNVPGKSNLAQHQSKDLLYFLRSKGPSLWLLTSNGKSLVHQLCAAIVKEPSSTGLKSVPRRLVCSNCLSACVKMGLGEPKVRLESLEQLKDSCRPKTFYVLHLCLCTTEMVTFMMTLLWP